MLRKKQNESIDDKKYYISSEEIILPFNNQTSGLTDEMIYEKIESLNPIEQINKIITNLMNGTERKKAKEFRQIIENFESPWINGSIELDEYAVERLSFLEKYKLLNEILKNYDDLTPKQTIYKNYLKNLFIYEINGEPKLFSNIDKSMKYEILLKKPDGFYLFNKK